MSSKHIGQVKWFNNKIGYGFITLLTENNSNNKDVFVHHQNVCPLESNYRTLRTGEYVEFILEENCDGEHKEQATKVSGIMGNELLCDFIHRNNNKRGGNKQKSNTDLKSDKY